MPQIGWNSVRLERPHPAFEAIPSDSYFYFVHSYYVEPADPAVALGTTDHGITFASVVARRNLLGVQLPDLVLTTLGRIGSAALPLGLMAVGGKVEMFS